MCVTSLVDRTCRGPYAIYVILTTPTNKFPGTFPKSYLRNQLMIPNIVFLICSKIAYLIVAIV